MVILSKNAKTPGYFLPGSAAFCVFAMCLCNISFMSDAYFLAIYPFAFRVSAQSTAPPAAPRTVLWESPTNFQS